MRMEQSAKMTSREPQPLWWWMRALIDALAAVLIFAGGMSLTGAPISGRTAIVFGVGMALWKLGFEYWRERRSGSGT